ncbi:hypothetical protein GTP91_33140, partial [Rugamonas sp. FT82W]|nr:hypothetical protein [Duganella vulcania]
LGWVSRHGERLPFPRGGTARARCPHSGEQYLLEDGRCTLLTDDGRSAPWK